MGVKHAPLTSSASLRVSLEPGSCRTVQDMCSISALLKAKQEVVSVGIFSSSCLAFPASP